MFENNLLITQGREVRFNMFEYVLGGRQVF